MNATLDRPRMEDECPPMVSPRAMTPDGLPGRWLIAQTRPRHEKALASDLIQQGFDYFLPLRKSVRKCGRTRHVNYLPVLPTFVFCVSESYGDLKDFLYRNRFSTDRLVEVHADAQEQLKVELSKFFGAVTSGKELAGGFVKGRRCKVKQGHALENHEGVIERCGHRGWVFLKITILGQSVPVEIETDFLEPL